VATPTSVVAVPDPLPAPARASTRAVTADPSAVRWPKLHALLVEAGCSPSEVERIESLAEGVVGSYRQLESSHVVVGQDRVLVREFTAQVRDLEMMFVNGMTGELGDARAQALEDRIDFHELFPFGRGTTSFEELWNGRVQVMESDGKRNRNVDPSDLPFSIRTALKVLYQEKTEGRR